MSEQELDFTNVQGYVGNLYSAFNNPHFAKYQNQSQSDQVFTDEDWQEFHKYQQSQERKQGEVAHIKERNRDLNIITKECFDVCLPSDFFYFRPSGQILKETERKCLEECAIKSMKHHQHTKKLFTEEMLKTPFNQLN
ncbi:developmentally-regulated protein [Acrasis kona]|uniref:Mitochondrial import inner membrane translocase subunit n=1 Tax=Acrasis kona TaxID=1008807 RepID=A0AAW2Z1B9_9EUKA